ncbi:MAG: phosphotransferase family protein [Gammaproteobacteria bacterium]|nr:phosphotransferase family protein [Gammaproteobacteria bacterium]
MEAQNGTREVSVEHQFEVLALENWLKKNILNFSAPLKVSMFKGGQSNPSYWLQSPTRNYVMRAKPGPVHKLLPSAHAVEREFRLMSAIAHQGVPVPEMLALCEDESIIGRAFYIMEYVEGRIFWEQSLPYLQFAERRPIYQELNRVIANLHNLNYQNLGLEDFGKPGNYFVRQMGRWSKQYVSSETKKIEAMDKLMEWLPNNIPPSAMADITCIVHGDYRLDNVIYQHSSPKMLAVIDWELSTLGHPLADFSYHCMGWQIPPATFRGLAGLDLKAAGIPLSDEYVAWYCDQTNWFSPADLKADWNFYMAYNLFRMAAILQGIAKRVEMGTASSSQAKQTGENTSFFANLGWDFACSNS